MAKRFKAALALVVACLGVALLVAATPAWAALSAPAHTKTAQLNEDGTVTIRLDVTGASETSTTSQGANVYVVVDTSGSMGEVVSGITSYSLVDPSSYNRCFGPYVGSTAYGLVDGNYVELDVRRENTGSWWNPNYVFTFTVKDTGQLYTGDVYRAVGTTRMDVAKGALRTMGNTLLAQDNVKVTLIPFDTNVGTVSGPFSKGNTTGFDTAVNNMSAEGGTDWDAALRKAGQLAGQHLETPAYVIFLSDGKPTFRLNANGGVAGSGSDDNDGKNLDAAVAAANGLPANVKALYSIYNGADAADGMKEFSNRVTKTFDEKEVYDGTNADSLNAALANIAQETTNSASYKDVVITDVLSQWVEYELPAQEMVNSGFTYYKNDEPWADAPKANIDASGHVKWDLSSVGKLEDGAKYAIEFKVKLKPEAYQEAAKSDGDSLELPTNADGTQVDYTVLQETTGGSSTEAPGSDSYEIPTVPVPKTKLVISKTVAGNMGNVNESFNFTVDVPNGTYYVNNVEQKVENEKLSFQLKHGETVTINGLMPGAHAVSEVRDNVTGMTTAINGSEVKGSDAGDNKLAFSTEATIPNSSKAVTVAYVNASEAAPIVGYSDNTTPFMVLMTVALAGAGAAGAHAFARSREE